MSPSWQWQALPQSGSDVPEARSSHSITAAGSSLLLFGGEHDPRTPLSSELYCYSLEGNASGTWSKLAATGAVPSPRLAHSATAIGTTVYFFGGRCGKQMGEGAFDELYAFDTAAGAWSLVAPANGSKAPEARSFHAAAAAAQGAAQVYVFGGCGADGRLADLHRFDARAHSWEALPSNPSMPGRGGAALVAAPDGKRLYVLGGFCGHELPDLAVFDLAAHKWEQGPPLPSARSVLGAAVLGSSLVAFGGEVDPSTKGHEGAGDFDDKTWGLGLGGGAAGWELLAPGATSPGPRGWYASTPVATGGGGFVVHGGLDRDNERLGDMWVLGGRA